MGDRTFAHAGEPIWLDWANGRGERLPNGWLCLVRRGEASGWQWQGLQTSPIVALTLSTNFSDSPVRCLSLSAYSPPSSETKHQIKWDGINGFKYLGLERDQEAAERVEEKRPSDDWASGAARASLAPSTVTSIHQVRSSLPFPSSCAKTCTPYPNASYLYSDLTQL